MKVKLESLTKEKVIIKKGNSLLGMVNIINILNPVQLVFFKKGIREFDLNFKYIFNQK
jgi:hypothetical protein